MRKLLLIALLACGGSSGTMTGSGLAETLVVQPSGGQSFTLSTPGSTLQLVAFQQSSDGYGGSVMRQVAATWRSANAGVATVDQDGLVTAVATGSSEVTAMSGSAHGTVTVTVR